MLCITYQALLPSLSTVPPFFLSLCVLKHNDQYPNEDGNKINKQIQGMLDVVCVTMFSFLYNDLQHWRAKVRNMPNCT